MTATKKAVQEKPAKQERRKRTPLGAQRMKGAVEGIDRKKYVDRWINDTPGRIAAALEGGWQFVDKSMAVVGEGEDKNNDLGSMVSQHGGYDAGGKPYKRYLMVIRREFYEEDKAAKAAELNEIDRAIKAGKFKNSNDEHGYVPKNGIKIS